MKTGWVLVILLQIHGGEEQARTGSQNRMANYPFSKHKLCSMWDSVLNFSIYNGLWKWMEAYRWWVLALNQQVKDASKVKQSSKRHIRRPLWKGWSSHREAIDHVFIFLKHTGRPIRDSVVTKHTGKINGPQSKMSKNVSNSQLEMCRCLFLCFENRFVSNCWKSFRLMHKTALWEIVSWGSSSLNTHLNWKYIKWGGGSGKKRSALVLEMFHVSLKILRMHSSEHFGTFMQRLHQENLKSTGWKTEMESHHTVYVLRLHGQIVVQPLQMLTLGGRQRPKSVNSWPTWGEWKAVKHTQKLQYAAFLTLC